MGAGQGIRMPLVLGIGNSLLSDDGIGIHVINALDSRREVGNAAHEFQTRDGGTIGLALLSELDRETDLIVVDAMELGAVAGTVRTFLNADMDRQLTGTKRSAHEVALADLIMAAELSGCAPRRRALVAVQPEITTWGLSPTPAVERAVGPACDAVLTLIREWSDER